MIRPRTAIVLFSIAAAAAFFWLGAIYAGRVDAATNAEYDARLDALRAELNRAMAREANAVGTAGERPERDAIAAERSALITDIKSASASGATDADLTEARRRQRRAQFLLDFIEAENSMGFHADQEAMRVLALSLDEARQGQVALRGSRRDVGVPGR